MDALYNQVFRELLSYMMQDPKTIPQATRLLLVAGNLERVGDHATNLAEMVVYMVEGKRIDINRAARSQT
jgi:phosphate transport system protein